MNTNTDLDKRIEKSAEFITTQMLSMHVQSYSGGCSLVKREIRSITDPLVEERDFHRVEHIAFKDACDRRINEVEALKKERDELRPKLEASEAAAAEMRDACLKAIPTEGAWENECPICHAKTDCGDIPHKDICPTKILKGTNYIRTDAPAIQQAIGALKKMVPEIYEDCTTDGTFEIAQNAITALQNLKEGK